MPDLSKQYLILHSDHSREVILGNICRNETFLFLENSTDSHSKYICLYWTFDKTTKFHFSFHFFRRSKIFFLIKSFYENTHFQWKYIIITSKVLDIEKSERSKRCVFNVLICWLFYQKFKELYFDIIVLYTFVTF